MNRTNMNKQIRGYRTGDVIEKTKVNSLKGLKKELKN